MSRRTVMAVMVAVAVAAVGTAGCGVRPTGILSAGSNPVVNGQPSTMTLYLVHGKRLERVARPGLAGHPYLPLAQLGVPVTAEERRKGLRSEITDTSGVIVYPVRRGVLGVQLLGLRFGDDDRVRPGGEWSRLALAQVVCTTEAIPGVSVVRVSDAFEEGRSETMRCDRFADLLR